jgi:hypothetical protein
VLFEPPERAASAHRRVYNAFRDYDKESVLWKNESGCRALLGATIRLLKRRCST